MSLCISCSNQSVTFDKNKYGRIHTIPDSSCNFIKSRYGLGLILIDYKSEYNKVKLDGVKTGLVVSNVMLGSPADINNVPVGAVITTINGLNIEDTSMFSKIIQSPNKTFELGYRVQSQTNNIKIKNVQVSEYMNGCTNQLKYK